MTSAIAAIIVAVAFLCLIIGFFAGTLCTVWMYVTKEHRP